MVRKKMNLRDIPSSMEMTPCTRCCCCCGGWAWCCRWICIWPPPPPIDDRRCSPNDERSNDDGALLFWMPPKPPGLDDKRCWWRSKYDIVVVIRILVSLLWFGAVRNMIEHFAFYAGNCMIWQTWCNEERGGNHQHQKSTYTSNKCISIYYR